MQTTYNPLTPIQKQFFRNMENYLDTPVYFFGSVQRLDYVPGYSDVDVILFADNMTEMQYKLTSFLKRSKTDMKRIVKHLGNYIFQGYKIFYKNADASVIAEINIFPSVDKSNYLRMQHELKENVPFIICVIMYIIKLVYYRLGFLSSDQYRYLKKSLLSFDNSNEFVSID
jgi:hypothetical protein